ncbi:putative Rho-type GTPase-activating protein 3 [Smittium culicis]|uniref:Putative Rho-type GTPase-activating protein 3 n=1 Tax=Smittium culicis TaxID=133412 RepID=A0A1R1XK69_9FUNG|nr:putative Rho-type GTPase-activating protein 3 [Smittium culicis]
MPDKDIYRPSKTSSGESSNSKSMSEGSSSVFESSPQDQAPIINLSQTLNNSAQTNKELNKIPHCWGCSKVIEKGNAIQFADGVWHLECFKCTSCKKLISFDSNLLFLADGKPICSDCSYSCSLCKKQIFDEAIVTAEGTYHSECFRCGQCKNKIQGKSFAKTNAGIIYCVPCYTVRKERKKISQLKQLEKNKRKKDLPKLPENEPTESNASTKNPEIKTTFDNKTSISFDYEDIQLISSTNNSSDIPSPSRTKPPHQNSSSLPKSYPSQKPISPDTQNSNNPNLSFFKSTDQQKPSNSSPRSPSDYQNTDIPKVFKNSPTESPNLKNVALNDIFKPPSLSELEESINKKITTINDLSISELKVELTLAYKHILSLENEIYAIKKSTFNDDLIESFVKNDSLSSLHLDESIPNIHQSKAPKPNTANNSLGISKKVEAFLGVSNSHAFSFFNTLRPVRCDKCNDLIWGINSKELRCRVCGYTCHQRCFAGATSYCVLPSNFKRDPPNGSAIASSNLDLAPNNTSSTPTEIDSTADIDLDIHNSKPILDDLFKRPLEIQASIEEAHDHIPLIVKSCVEYIETNGIEMEGIYRISGSSSDIKTIHNNILKVVRSRNNFKKKKSAKSPKNKDNVINNRNSCNFSSIFTSEKIDIDVSSATSVLKQYFRGLPIPLLTLEHYNEWISIFSSKENPAAAKSLTNGLSESDSIKIAKCREVGNKLPISHKNTLIFLLRHLQKVGKNSHKNLMPAANLSVVFAPNLLRLPESQFNQEMQHMSFINMCITFLINKVDVIWPENSEDTNSSQTTFDRKASVASDASVSPDDIKPSLNNFADRSDNSRSDSKLGSMAPNPTNFANNNKQLQLHKMSSAELRKSSTSHNIELRKQPTADPRNNIPSAIGTRKLSLAPGQNSRKPLSNINNFDNSSGSASNTQSSRNSPDGSNNPYNGSVFSNTNNIAELNVNSNLRNMLYINQQDSDSITTTSTENNFSRVDMQKVNQQKTYSTNPSQNSTPQNDSANLIKINAMLPGNFAKPKPKHKSDKLNFTNIKSFTAAQPQNIYQNKQ